MDSLLQQQVDFSSSVLDLACNISNIYYKKPLVLTYSGGKDSDVLVNLALSCLSPSSFKVVNSHTTVDAPETVYYIRKMFEYFESIGVSCEVIYPRDKDGKFLSMWDLIVKNGIPPTRLNRFCCRTLKEISVPDSLVCLGVRSSESKNRENRNVFGLWGKNKNDALYFSYEKVYQSFLDSEDIRKLDSLSPEEFSPWDCQIISSAKNHEKIVCNPIYFWSRSDVWNYLNYLGVPHNPLYDSGFTRVGCVGCPYNSKRKLDFERYPKYEENYKRAFTRLIQERKKKGLPCKWESSDDLFSWWVQDYTIPGQMSLDDFN